MIMVSESKDSSGAFPQITNIGDSALMVLIGEGVNPVINNVVHLSLIHISEPTRPY